MHRGNDASEVIVESVDVIWTNIVCAAIVDSFVSFSISMMVLVARNWLNPNADAYCEQVHYVKDVFDSSPLDIAVIGLCYNLVGL